MELFSNKEYLGKANPQPGQRLVQQLLEKKANNLRGMFFAVPAGHKSGYHFHKKRESIFIIISGKLIAVIDGKSYRVETGDILFIPPIEKHGMLNDSGEEIRLFEFQTGNPDEQDAVDIEWPKI